MRYLSKIYLKFLGNLKKMGVVHFIVNISPIWSSKNLRTKSVVDFIFNDNLPKDLISFFPRILRIKEVHIQL